MLDIKGQQVNMGDRVLVSSKYYGLVLTKLARETKTNYFFEGNVERLPRYEKLVYVGSNWLHPDGTLWSYQKHGAIDYSIATRKNRGDNNTKYKLKDMTNEKQVRVLKVEDDFTL